MKKRSLALVLACLLLAGCGPVRTEPLNQESAPADEPEVAYVPLDDRPDNEERVVYLAESLGYALAIPYLPDYFPRFAALHVGLAAGACALLMLALLVILLILRRQRPERYGRLLIAWGLIVLGSAVLFLIPRMVSSALEVFFTISAALLARKLYMLRQGEL